MGSMVPAVGYCGAAWVAAGVEQCGEHWSGRWPGLAEAEEGAAGLD